MVRIDVGPVEEVIVELGELFERCALHQVQLPALDLVFELIVDLIEPRTIAVHAPGIDQVKLRWPVLFEDLGRVLPEGSSDFNTDAAVRDYDRATRPDPAAALRSPCDERQAGSSACSPVVPADSARVFMMMSRMMLVQLDRAARENHLIASAT